MARPIPFDNRYARLPERFFSPKAPTPVREPTLLRVNASLAEELGIDAAWLESDEGLAVLAGNLLPEGAEPIALAYAGHQFGHFVPQLGDGRAIVMGEVVDTQGRRRDLQWKGSGRTAYSRGGDGRAALGPVLREYVVSEAMHALGVPTARSLAAVATGEFVLREEPLPGAIVLRVAASHLRVGTFQYFAARNDIDGLRLLAEHAIERHDPGARDAANPVRALLEGVVDRQATLVAAWLAVGFVHGVMNTDNCTVSGETIDFGPCAFLEEFHPAKVFSSIDRGGRYAYGNQPSMAAWNLARLAESLLPLLAADEHDAIAVAHEVLDRFGPTFERAHLARFAAKLGLESVRDGDAELVQSLFELMKDAAVDFTQTFRRLADAALGQAQEAAFRELFFGAPAIDAWLERWRARLAVESLASEERAVRMRAVNPVYLPRNHLVEEAIQAARKGDLAPFERLCEVVTRPFDERPEWARYAAPARPEERVTRTFCGT